MAEDRPAIITADKRETGDGLRRAKAAREFGLKMREGKPSVFTNRVKLHPREGVVAL